MARPGRTVKQWVTAFREAHGDKYDYSLVTHTFQHDPIQIICPVHGIFSQNPYNHQRGAGCSKCTGGISVWTTKSWVAAARKVHGDTYDYSRVRYVNWKTHVEIGCRIHGFWMQAPRSHLVGMGCQLCGFTGDGHYDLKEYTFPNGRTVRVQGYEPLALDLLLAEGVRVRDLQVGMDEVPLVKYQADGKRRTYIPDIFHRPSNTLIEVKSDWTWRLTRDRNILKLDSARSAGYNVRLMIFDRYGTLVHDRSRMASDGSSN